MLIQICDNLIVSTDQVNHVHNNVLVLNNGEKFRLDDIGLRNIQKVADAMAVNLFGGVGHESE